MEFETGMSLEKVRSALKELEPKILYDYTSEIVFVTNHVKHQYAKKNKIAPTIAMSIVTDVNKLPEGHDFIDIFLDKYDRFFHLKGTVVLEYTDSEYYHGKGREGERLKYNDEFDKFWKYYPPRNGKKRGKPEAFKNFLKFKEDEWPVLIECSKNYAKSQKARSNFAKDPERFLKNNYWQDWKEPESEVIEPADQKQATEDLKRELRTANDALDRALEADKFTPSADSKERVQKCQREVNKLKKQLEV
jgi:hypothetical protein